MGVAPREGFERLLRLAAFVDERGASGCTISEIAENVPGYGHQAAAALKRALRRDLDDLAASTGILIEWSDDHQRYNIRPPLFTAKERQALISAAGVVDVEGVGSDLPPGEIGTGVDAAMAQVVVRVHHLVVAVRDAIASRRRITFRYLGPDGVAAERDIDPHAVGLWRNRWYVVGHDHDRAERRVFRLDRIVDGDGDTPAVTAGEPGSFEIPTGINPTALLTMDPNSWGTDPPLEAQVRVRRDHVPFFLTEFTGTIDQQDDSSATITVEVRDYESFLIRLLGFGTGVDLLDPPELSDLLRGWLAAQVDA